MDQDEFESLAGEFPARREGAEAAAHGDIDIRENSVELIVPVENIRNEGVGLNRGVGLGLQLNLHVFLSFL